jgi:arylsulfatase A-like enzyme
VRNQYHHSTDIVPTIFDICGVEMPKVYKGVEQVPLSGVSMRYSFDAAPDAPTQKERQYYAMLGTRGLWENGWKAVSVHAPISGKGHFDEDEWELYHVDQDRSESTDLARQHVYNFLGIKPEQQFVSPELKPGKYTLGMEFSREGSGGFHESTGTTNLYVSEKIVASGPMKTAWQVHAVG